MSSTSSTSAPSASPAGATSRQRLHRTADRARPADRRRPGARPRGRATGATRTRRRRRPVRRFMVVTHRWLSLVLGLVLLAITTSGCVLLYEHEIIHALNRDAYAASGGPERVGFPQALAAVHKAHPEFAPVEVQRVDGVLQVTDDTTSWNVDPSTGRVLGQVKAAPAWLGVLENLHECGLTCKDRAGYVSWLDKPIPHTGWTGYAGADVELGRVLLGLVGVILLYLCLTGLWLWFPRPRRLLAAFGIRWGRGRFARDTDLHKVIGVVALLPLLVWAVSGSAFELTAVSKAWYALTRTPDAQDAPLPTSTSPKGPDISMDRALDAAHRALPDGRVVSVTMPVDGDATSTWTIGMAHGFNPASHGPYPENAEVMVDRRSGATSMPYYGNPRGPFAQQLWEGWRYPLHVGEMVNGWWRVVWLLFGLTPLALAVTGLSTWLVRHRTRRNRKRTAKARKAAASA